MTDEFLLARVAKTPESRQAQAVAVSSLIGSARFDNEDVGCLAQMVAMGSEYLDEQDETSDAADIAAMQSVIVTLSELLQGETVEDEPVEPDAGRSTTDSDTANVADAPSKPDAAPKGTSSRSAASTALYNSNRKGKPSWLL